MSKKPKLTTLLDAHGGTWSGRNAQSRHRIILLLPAGPSYAFRLGAKIYIAPDPRPSVPIKDMKLLRDQLAQVIGENKRLANRKRQR